jgi:hypothetical protein
MNEAEAGSRTSSPRHRAGRWYVRMPLKWLAFALVTFFVLFPNPVLFVRHVKHLSNLNAMVQPGAPELATWDGEVRQRLLKLGAASEVSDGPLAELSRHAKVAPSRIQQEVERFVYEKVAYEWDWDQWGNADYMPTVAEMFAQAQTRPNHQLKEDCDGRAVMAASLMRRLGYESRIVTDLRHVWVATPEGQWMGPGRAQTVVSTPQGNKVILATALSNIGASLSFGVAVFPLLRELLIAAAAFLLAYKRGVSSRLAGLGGLLLLQGLLFLRLGPPLPRGDLEAGAPWSALVGVLHVIAGLVVLVVGSFRARRAAAHRVAPAAALGPTA